MNYQVNFIFKYLLILFFLYSCAPSKTLAPVEDKSGLEYTRTVDKASKKLVIAKGDNLYAISKKEGVSVRSIIDINKLEPPFVLHPGDQLIIPLIKKHIVKDGETLWSLSKCYGVDIITLRQINNLNKQDYIKKGMKLRIPSNFKKFSSECLKEISRTKIVRKESINKNISEINKSKEYNYIWPVKGKIISKFGISSSGLKNDGVNILSDKGKPVKAVDSGKVVYAGNEIQAFGYLILIKHKNDKTTAYAHLESLEVFRGQFVNQGEVIAYVGDSGKVTVPQLHFELRDSSGPLNPLKFLPENISKIN